MIKRRLFYVLVITSIAMIILMSSCTLPKFDFEWSTPNPIIPTASAVAPVATPEPINPTYTPPTNDAGVISSGGALDFASIIAEVRPSVVAINTEISTESLFGTFTQEGAGSGWILDNANGYIVTNNHVVEGAKNISVTLEDGRSFTVDTVRRDSISDLAVLKINADNLPKALMRGDSSQMRVGDWVIAIGNSLGQGISATKGIVSAKGVSVEADNGETLYDLIQTDAAINPGNSGGPLVNLAGEVIGINSIKVAQVGVEGMGYAISGKAAFPLIMDLINKGYVTRPWMGVGLYTVNDTVFRRYQLAVDTGVLITEVVSGGPADTAGLESGDIIVNIAGKDVATVEDLVREIRSHSVGSTVDVTYWHEVMKKTVSVTLGQSPSTSP